MQIPAKILFLFLVSVSLAGFSFAQTKTVETIESEIDGLANAESFSVTYERDITTVRLFFDMREDNLPLQKPFKEFSLELNAIYAGPGVDDKPFRNRLCMTAKSKKFYFASNRKLILFLNGDPLDFVEGERTTELKGRNATEILCWDIDRKLLEDIAESQTISFKIDAWNIVVPGTKRGLFKKYLALLTAQKTTGSNQ